MALVNRKKTNDHAFFTTMVSVVNLDAIPFHTSFPKFYDYYPSYAIFQQSRARLYIGL